MHLQLQDVFILLKTFCFLMSVISATKNQQKLRNVPLIQGIPIISSQARANRIAEFVSSHQIADNVNRQDFSSLDNDYKNKEKKEHETDVNLKNNSRSEPLLKDGVLLKMILAKQSYNYSSDNKDFLAKDETISKIQNSAENLTTMLPILTTQRDTQLFDFVPINIIREDGKGNPFVPFDNKNFEDLSDISLVPAGSNTRIQVKKGPNGKDYEYEYVYYYYDEEEGKPTSNSQEAFMRMSTSTIISEISARRGNSIRNKYNGLYRSTTIEPIINEVIPSQNESKTRHLDNSHEDIFEEKLLTNTRFPPRLQVNQAVETTDRAIRGRGNRQRATLDSIDSNSYHGIQEGPEFPQNLPNGPVRFLGVTPNESREEKVISRGRLRPQRIQEPAPVHEIYEETTYARKRPTIEQYEVLSNQEKTQAQIQPQFRQHPYSNKKEDEFGEQISSISINSSPRNLQEEKNFYTDIVMDITDSPTTEMFQAMDKVALDLYAFLQQGRSNFIDFVKDAEEDRLTTEFSSSFSESTLSDTEFEDSTSTLNPFTTTAIMNNINITTTISTTTMTTPTTHAPSSSSEEPISVISPLGRSKIRRPGISGPAISRNRFKSVTISSNFNNADIKPTETSLINSSTQKIRGRFGHSSGNSGFKRIRPSVSKQSQHLNVSLDEQLQKESKNKINSETKPVAGRGRFRGMSTRSALPAKTTLSTPIRDKLITTVSNSSSVISAVSHRFHGFNKINSIGRRRGQRPAREQNAPSSEQTLTTMNLTQENNSNEQRPTTKLSTVGVRSKTLNKPIIKPGAGRLNLRQRIGQSTISTSTETATVEMAVALPVVDGTIDEPASEGTEKETREAPVEPAARFTTINPLSKLRNRNKIQVQLKTTTARTSLPPASRRSPLLPRRKTSETLFQSIEPSIDAQSDPILTFDESEVSTESSQLTSENNFSINIKHEESSKILSNLLATRRRIALRKSGKLIPSISK